MKRITLIEKEFFANLILNLKDKRAKERHLSFCD
jgi:hypothetical protein